MRAGLLLWVGLACALLGCPGDDDVVQDAGPGVDAPGTDGGSPPADAPGVDADAFVAPRLEIGTGLVEFIEVAEGDDVELVAGPQGGWHVDVAIRLYGMNPMDMTLEIHGFDDATDEQLTVPIRRILTMRRVRDQGDHFLRLGDQAVFMVLSPEEAVARDLRLEVRAVPAEGEGASATKVVHVIDEIE